MKNTGCPNEATLTPSPQGPCQFLPLLILYFLPRMGLNYKAGRCSILRYFSWGLGVPLAAATAGLFVGERQRHSRPCTGREESPCRIWCYSLLLSEYHNLLPGLLWELTQNPNHLLRICPKCSSPETRLLHTKAKLPTCHSSPLCPEAGGILFAWLQSCQSSDALVLPHLHVLCVPISCVVSHQVPVYQRSDPIPGDCDCVFCQPSGHYMDTRPAIFQEKV